MTSLDTQHKLLQNDYENLQKKFDDLRMERDQLEADNNCVEKRRVAAEKGVAAVKAERDMLSAGLRAMTECLEREQKGESW